MKIVIVGGSLGGLAALARLRRLITVRPVITSTTYHVGGVIQSGDALLVPNAENLSERPVSIRIVILSISTVTDYSQRTWEFDAKH